jgi:isoleucyl-tRNA synthetase
VGASVEIDVEGEPILLLPTEVEVRKSPKTNYAVAEELGLLVGVDTRMTPELEQEGVARELVRHIQELRKKADFRIDDRILTYWQGGPQVQAAVARFGDYIAAETLSVKLNEQTAPDGTFMATIDIEGEAVTLGVKRVGYG